MNIGIFGGTFDPIHYGHINLALELKEKQGLDEVWFCPANISPFRQETPPTSIENRLQMVEIALSDIPGVKMLDLESRRPAPSYTIDTIEEILEKYGEGNRFFLLLGADALKDFDKWKDYKKILTKSQLLVGKRPGGELSLKQTFGARFVDSKMMEIEATEIRKRLNKRLYCGHLVPSKVLDFIYINDLYFNA